MKAKAWHRQSEKYQRLILDRGGITYGQFKERFKQPAWCTYHEALTGIMGCWSLMRPGRIRTVKDCGQCELIKVKV